MKKYFVIATHYDTGEERQRKYIAGEFSVYTNAVLFRDAYNNRYKSDAVIIDDYMLLHSNVMEG